MSQPSHASNLSRTDLIARRDSLQRQLQSHYARLSHFEEQRANAGLHVPFEIEQGIKQANRDIEETEAKLEETLARLKVQESHSSSDLPLDDEPALPPEVNPSQGFQFGKAQVFIAGYTIRISWLLLSVLVILGIGLGGWGIFATLQSMQAGGTPITTESEASAPTATPTLVEPDLPVNPTEPTTPDNETPPVETSNCPTASPLSDISGRWDGPSGDFWIFTRPSSFGLDFHYQEFDRGGSGWGKGIGSFHGNLLVIKGHNGEGYTNEYSGELCLENNQLIGIIKYDDGDEVSIALNGTPSPIPTPLPSHEATVPEMTTDLSGRWDNPSGGYIEFTRPSAASLDYRYREVTGDDSNWGEGDASFEGNVLVIEGHNGETYAHQYSGELYLYDNELRGIIRDAVGNEIPIILSRVQ
jgi:hypothetical protein